MSKSRHSTKEAKKQPLMSPKEKRAAKHQKSTRRMAPPSLFPTSRGASGPSGWRCRLA